MNLRQRLSFSALLAAMSKGELARTYLDDSQPDEVQKAAGAMLVDRLKEYQGAGWIGTELDERADVIRAFRKMGKT